MLVIATVLPSNVYGTVSTTVIMVAGMGEIREDMYVFQGGHVCVDWLFNPSLEQV